MQDRIHLTVHNDGVADVRLARPEKMNALDEAMFDALVATGQQLLATPGLRAVVLSGEGRAFCAGLDLGRIEKMGTPPDPETQARFNAQRYGPRTHGLCNRPQYAAMAWQALPVPVIAAVHGVAFGGGLQVALGADIRLVTADVRLSVLEIKWGLVPDMGGMVRLRQLLRGDVAAELCYSGRIVGGEEATRIGLATRVCDDPYAEALAMAQAMARRNPHAIRANKRLLQLATHASDAALLQAESDEQALLMGSANQVEAVAAEMGKRAPRFIDPA